MDCWREWIRNTANHSLELQSWIVNPSVPEERLIEALSSREFRTKLSELEASLASSPAADCAQRFTALLQSTLKSVSTTKRKKKISQRNTFPRNSWFDKDCKESKKKFKNIAKQMKSNPNDPLIRDAFWKERPTKQGSELRNAAL